MPSLTADNAVGRAHAARPAQPNEAARQPARNRRRILFFAEAVTLAHAARPVALAKSLNDDQFDVHLAWDPRYASLCGPLPFPTRDIESIPTAQFLAALARGGAVYDLTALERYVETDAAILDQVKPDLVVGDFRLSLSVSARRAAVPYVNITNAYWSPYAKPTWDVPDLAMVRWLGVPVARLAFRLALPWAFALQCKPLNRLRRRFGLPALGRDLRRVYTDADATLYADLEPLIPTFDRPGTHRYIGPILWSPAVPTPPWWDELPADRPIVYVTLGSSGADRLLPGILRALAELEVTVLAATAGRGAYGDAPANAFIADYLPGDLAARRADCVICNGGSPTAYQALAAGKPVLCVPTNLDQHLNTHYLRRAGAALAVRSDRAQPRRIRDAVTMLIREPAFRERAACLSRLIAETDCRGALIQCLDSNAAQRAAA